MTADSVPAPMVQLPAETVEKLREALRVWGTDYISGARGEVLTAARAVVDAAHPAASDPAADSERVTRLEAKIIATANQRDDALAEVRRVIAAYDTICVSMERWKERAEQADKGEAADTPRDDETIKCPTCGVARGWNEDGRLTRGIWTLNCVRCGSFQVEIEDAPAAPPEPLCEAFGCHDWRCQACKEKAARVPVNDEAEAWRLTEDEHKTLRAAFKKHGVPEYGFYNQVVRHIHEFFAARGEDA